MGLIQNKVTVSQPNSHVVVKNAGGLRGLTGETGPQGPQGVPGEAATVTAGTTTTLPAGSDATVQNVGSTSAAIFNFGIPKGDKGDTGETGAAATISVGSTSTLPAGSSATVTNSGTSSAAVFDFGIPKGDKGDTGATGADGYSPSATVTKTGDTATITITDKDGTTTASISDGTTPTVNDGTLTIQKNGTTVQTFSADQASNVTANITVPTQFSELSGTVSSSQIEDEAITTGSVSGTGTNITLAGTMEGGAIESVELNGDTEQTTYSGKNLYEGSPSFNAFSGISAWEDGGTYNGMPVIKRAAAWTGAYRLINIEAGATYTFSAWVKSDEARPVAIYAIGSGATATITPNNKNITTSTSWERVSFTFACSTSGTVALRFENTSASTTNYTYVSGYQLEKNSSMTSFEPYVGGTASPNPDYPQEVQTVTGRQVVTISDGGSQSQEYEINLGKNLLDKSSASASLEGYFNNVNVSLNAGTRMAYIPCLQNTTYTVSKIESKRFAVATTTVVPDAGVAVSGYISDNTGTSITITTGSSAKYLCVFYYLSTSDTLTPQEILDTLQIEKGSTATTYAPYFTPIELCKIGTYQDYIYKSGEDWYVHKVTGKVTFTGAETETWSSATAATGYVRFSTASGETHADNNGYCNELINRGSQSHGAYEYVWVQPNANAFYIQVLNTRANDLSSFRTWLGANPATVYYDISTPTDTQITNATLISELEDLLSATTYSGATYITVSGDLASPLEVVAEADSKLAPDSVYGAAIKDGAVSTDKIEDGSVTPAKISTSAYQSGETAVGTWIDGKTIYRQVLTGYVQITANTVATVSTTISVASIVSTGGWYQTWKQNDTVANRLAFGQIMADKVYSYALVRSGNYIELGFISTVNVTSKYEVVIEYTKNS